MDEQLRSATERAWREIAEIDAAHARGELDDHGWHDAMAALAVPRGRLVIGKFNEELRRRSLEPEVASSGFRITGRAERPHRAEPRLAYRSFWIDRG